MATNVNRDGDDDLIDETWTEDEVQWYLMGPFDGKVPGLVRRVRRILGVSQRGLAAFIEVSQSVVARWETGRVSPRVSVLHRLLQMAGLTTVIHDEDGVEVGSMREDGARDMGGRRYPAHVDLTVRGWWVPRHVQSTMAEYPLWIRRSRARRIPRVRFRTCLALRMIERLMDGTPEDHPGLHQLVAEAVHLDELAAERRERARSGRPWPPPDTGGGVPRSA